MVTLAIQIPISGIWSKMCFLPILNHYFVEAEYGELADRETLWLTNRLFITAQHSRTVNGKPKDITRRYYHAIMKKQHGSNLLLNFIKCSKLDVKQADALSQQVKDVKDPQECYLANLTFQTATTDDFTIAALVHYFSNFVHGPNKHQFSVRVGTTKEWRWMEQQVVVDGMHTSKYDIGLTINGVIQPSPFFQFGGLIYCDFTIKLQELKEKTLAMYANHLIAGMEIAETKPAKDRSFYMLTTVNKCLLAFMLFIEEQNAMSNNVDSENPTTFDCLVALEGLLTTLRGFNVNMLLDLRPGLNGKKPYMTNVQIMKTFSIIDNYKDYVIGYIDYRKLINYLNWLLD